MDYIDNVLIKLRRTYSKDETVAALDKKLRETEYELGVVRSERDEAVSELDRLRKMEKHYKNVIENCKTIRDKNRELKAENRFLIAENEDLRSKF